MSSSTTMRIYHCALCGKRLKENQWIYSRFTGNRYCPNDCKPKRKRKESS